MRRMGLTVESSPGEGLGRGCGASSARRGMGLGLRRMGLTVESSPGEGWDGVAAHSAG